MCRSSSERTSMGSGGRSQDGMTLLEMILFIVVIGVVGAVVVTMMSAPLTGAGTQVKAVTAAQLAQGRMELVLGQKRRAGFPGADPCQDSTLAACGLPADWSVDTRFEPWQQGNDPAMDDFAVIVITVSDPDGGSHSIRSLVARLGGDG